MNKRRIKKAWRKHIGEGKALTDKENTALYNGRGDFTKKVVKQLGLDSKEWYQEMTYNVFPKSMR